MRSETYIEHENWVNRNWSMSNLTGQDGPAIDLAIRMQNGEPDPWECPVPRVAEVLPIGRHVTVDAAYLERMRHVSATVALRSAVMPLVNATVILRRNVRIVDAAGKRVKFMRSGVANITAHPKGDVITLKLVSDAEAARLARKEGGLPV